MTDPEGFDTKSILGLEVKRWNRTSGQNSNKVDSYLFQAQSFFSHYYSTSPKPNKYPNYLAHEMNILPEIKCDVIGPLKE